MRINKSIDFAKRETTITKETPDDDRELGLSIAARASLNRCCLAFNASSSS
jgi:hypothetical protein